MIKPKARRLSEVMLAKFKKDYATLNIQKLDNIKKMQKLLTKKNVTEYFNLMSANKKKGDSDLSNTQCFNHFLYSMGEYRWKKK